MARLVGSRIESNLISEVHQGLLLAHLQNIFPGEPMHVNNRDDLSLKYPNTGAKMEVDIWIPNHNICFEFQDEYHYTTMWYYQNPKHKIQQNDDEKQAVMRKSELSLVVIPCWWDGEFESLVSTINFSRPDLAGQYFAAPIPFNPTENFFEVSSIPDVGELMLASFPVDPSFHESISSNTWWMGEKYDGIRFCWNPTHQSVFTRAGRELVLPEELETQLPDIYLDGEIWFGRGQFSDTYMLVSGSPDSVEWHLLRMISFDVPSFDVQNKPFEERYRYLYKHVIPDHPFNMVTFRIQCKGSSHLNLVAHCIIEEEGEGVILRKSKSIYEHGRTASLIKLKASQEDKEAIVVGTEASSVHLQLPNGTTFSVPPNDVFVRTPKIGDVVSFAFESHARRYTPVNPKIYRIRTDVSWEEVVRNAFMEEKDVFNSQPLGHWTAKNMRLFLEEFARKRNQDPLLPETWYGINFEDIHQTPGGDSILQKFKGGYKQALQKLFPELNLDNNSFRRSSWYEISNRRNFFENYAMEQHFDPLNPENWYSQPWEAIMSHKGAVRVMNYHSNSVSKALCDLYPNIGLEPSKFNFKPQWHQEEIRKHFFEKYAEDNSFDPDIPENWYSQPFEKIMATKGAREVMLHYQGSVAKALCELYPQLNLQPSKFMFKSWYQVEQRKFFEKYAQENEFDPLIAENWYYQLAKIIAEKEAREMKLHYKEGVAKALCDLFPNIGLDPAKFKASIFWDYKENRRKFFESYAKENGFDPFQPENWYTRSREHIMSTSGATKVVSYHNNRLTNALCDLFPDVALDQSKFKLQASKYSVVWNGRKFFNNYAKEREFDPLIPDNWYSQPIIKILEAKGANEILQHHDGSVTNALCDLFPDIGLSKYRLQAALWDDVGYRKEFFETYAKDFGFDPLNPENWYSQSRELILSQKGARRIMSYHNNSVSTALLELFPDIGLDRSKLKLQNCWSNTVARKKFFTKYAKENGFDPYSLTNWDVNRRKDILTNKDHVVI